MKVNVTVQVALDPQAWNEEYRDNSSVQDIRRMVKSDVEQAVACTFMHLPFIGITVK